MTEGMSEVPLHALIEGQDSCFVRSQIGDVHAAGVLPGGLAGDQKV